MIERKMPQNLEKEMAVLGSAFNHICFRKVSEELLPEMFMLRMLNIWGNIRATSK